VISLAPPTRRFPQHSDGRISSAFPQHADKGISSDAQHRLLHPPSSRAAATSSSSVRTASAAEGN
jgi:hypothetical protein